MQLYLSLAEFVRAISKAYPIDILLYILYYVEWFLSEGYNIFSHKYPSFFALCFCSLAMSGKIVYKYVNLEL